jgi:pimeloyl-ACP methyl ester carboxylesterase
MTTIKYRRADLDGLQVFYHEAGRADGSPLLLLHGFPSASPMFRDLIPQLADEFHVIAPDLPGFGQSDMPGREKFDCTFENITHVIDSFTGVVALGRKNHLFAGSDDGARHWAVLASLIETTKLNGIDPQAWMTWAIARHVDGHLQSRLDQLLPWNYSKTAA